MKHSDLNLNANYSVRVARSIPEVEEIREFWEKMQWHPNSDIDAFLTVISLRPDIIRPHVILVFKNDEPVTILVGRIENHRFPCKIGYKIFYQPLVKTFIVLHGGLLGDKSPDVCNILVSELTNTLTLGEAGLVFINHMRIDSSLYEGLMSSTNRFSKDKMLVTDTHWQMALPGSIEAFFQSRSRKHRYWLNRLLRMLDKDFPGGITVQPFKQKEQVDQLCKDAEAIAVKTYQRGLGVGFIDCPEIRGIFNLAAEEQWLRGYILYIKEKPCAFSIGRRYGNTFYYDYTGYDTEFNNYEPGTVIFVKMLEDLCNEKNIEYFDFGFGEAGYKQRFGDRSWEDASLYLYPKTLSGLKLNLMRSTTSSLSIHGKRFLERYNLLDKVKKRYRDLIRPKEKPKSDEIDE